MYRRNTSGMARDLLSFYVHVFRLSFYVTSFYVLHDR
jgi:hypothetical protein